MCMLPLEAKTASQAGYEEERRKPTMDQIVAHLATWPKVARIFGVFV